MSEPPNARPPLPPPPSAPNGRPPPTSVVQAGGQLAGDIVGGLKGSPTLLMLVILNCLVFGAAAFYMRAAAERYFNAHIKLIDQCFAIKERLDQQK